MKASDFNLEKEINFSFSTGEVTFKNSRLLIFDANALGLLRENILQKFGMEEARIIFLKFKIIFRTRCFLIIETNKTYVPVGS